LYFPDREGPTPIVFTLTPYIGQTYHDQAMYFASHGYAFVTVDVRGRGNSEGDFHPINEAADGYDVVEWLASQVYCNGKIAMWGGSYSGYVQWVTATEFPRHLSTIVPVASPYRGVDSPVRNNIFVPYTMRWLTLVSGRTSQEKIFLEERSFWSAQFLQWFKSGSQFKELDSFIGNPSRLFQEWITHPHRDDYWDSYNPTTEEYSKLSIPILTITGIYDADQLGALMHYRQHTDCGSAEGRSQHYLVIGPWDHAGTRTPKAEFGGLKVGASSLVDLRRLHLDWYEWVMMGGPKPQFLKDIVSYYVLGADKWRHAETLDAITARSQPLYLHATGNPTDVFKSGSLLTTGPRHSEAGHYVYDPRDVGLAELESDVDPDSLVDQRMVHAATGKLLIYHSDPFESDIEISGFFRFVAWISIDQPDTDLRVTVHEIGLDGTSILLANDSMRARYRVSSRESKLIHTTQPLQYDFQRFTFVSRQVRKGSRLRLIVGPINSIYSQKNYNSGGVVSEESMTDARVVTVKLFHDEKYSSTLFVPIAQAEDLNE